MVEHHKYLCVSLERLPAARPLDRGVRRAAPPLARSAHPRDRGKRRWGDVHGPCLSAAGPPRYGVLAPACSRRSVRQGGHSSTEIRRGRRGAIRQLRAKLRPHPGDPGRSCTIFGRGEARSRDSRLLARAAGDARRIGRTVGDGTSQPRQGTGACRVLGAPVVDYDTSNASRMG